MCLVAQFSSVAQSCPILCNPMDCSMPGFPVHHPLPELSLVWPFVTPWTVACQALLSMEFSRQEYWIGCHFLLQGIFCTRGSNLHLLHCRRQILYHWATKEKKSTGINILIHTFLIQNITSVLIFLHSHQSWVLALYLFICLTLFIDLSFYKICYWFDWWYCAKGDQPWIFIGRTDAEAEAPILWPPDAKSHLIRKDSNAVKDWRQEEEGKTKDEGCDGWTASLTEWTWVWANSGR